MSPSVRRERVRPAPSSLPSKQPFISALRRARSRACAREGGGRAAGCMAVPGITISTTSRPGRPRGRRAAAMLERPDIALRDWAAALRRARARRRLLVRGAAVASGCLALLATVIAPPLPRLIWNASRSMPVGLYRVMPDAAVRVGDIAIAWVPPAARGLAADRGYLPTGVP